MIKIGLLVENVRIPGFRLGNVFDVIDGRVEPDDLWIHGGYICPAFVAVNLFSGYENLQPSIARMIEAQTSFESFIDRL